MPKKGTRAGARKPPKGSLSGRSAEQQKVDKAFGIPIKLIKGVMGAVDPRLAETKKARASRLADEAFAKELGKLSKFWDSPLDKSTGRFHERVKVYRERYRSQKKSLPNSARNPERQPPPVGKSKGKE